MIITTTQSNVWFEGTQVKSTETDAKLEFGSEKQSIRGFGGCFNELGAIALETLSDDVRKHLLNELFSEDGCNFGFCRMPIGANDYAESWYSLNETDGDYEMKHFSIDRDRKHLLPYIKSAVKIKPDMKLFASPWSPPSWMKTHKTFNFGRLIQTDENLRAYALYFRKFVEAYKAEGVDIVQIHVQNEPFADTKYPSCRYSGEELKNFIENYLANELEGVSDIFFGTLNGPHMGEVNRGERYKDMLGYIMQDEKCRRIIKGVSYQWAGKLAVQVTHDDYPELEIIQSENECGDGKNTWNYAMYVFELMRHYFRNGVSSYIYWNMILKENGESTWGWWQNSMISVKDGKAVFNPEFYLMKHLSHFVKPGARYVETIGNWSSNSITFKNPDGKTVIVTANPYKENKVVSFDSKTYSLPAESFNTIVL